ncbi:hypothetical protein E3N88_45080 [Mikania micrantha]|uniref:Uncharacterized protein n=1 Tax=Mikania micrantha TaxID=192012 RepID=A0A5N6LAF7_9ASTR|nr:hypothetical protein E3N88_45080 [Mikania micrantha]
MIQTPFNLDAGPTASAAKKMSSATSFRSPFLHPPLKLSSSSSTSSQPHSFSFKRSTNQRFPHLIKSELDQNTVVAVAVGVVSVAVGLGIPIFYESQIDNAISNFLPESCRFCTGSGNVTVELGGGEKEVSKCINCDGAGALTCTTCQGSGIQPRYLDRREFKDDD